MQEYNHRQIFISLLIFGLLLNSNLICNAQQDDLWNKAICLQMQSENLIPGKLLMTMEMKNRKKKVEMTRETHLEMQVNETGEIEPKIVKVLEDGKDITAQELKAAEKAKAEQEEDEEKQSMSFSVGSESSIFHPDNQNKLKIRRLPGSEMINNEETIRYEYSMKGSEGFNEKGTAWLQSITGMPVKVESSPDPLPEHVNAMTTVSMYGTDEKGRWIMTRSDINGEGGFLFIKKYFSTTFIFDAYFEHIKTESEK